MAFKNYGSHIMLWLSLLFITGQVEISNAQIHSGVYITDVKNIRHELKITDNYITHSAYQIAPAKFIKTVGGFYTVDNNILKIELEFNSAHETNGLTELALPIIIADEKLTLPMDGELEFVKKEFLQQDLDGTWLFATRGPDKGQERRGDENTRKTLKFLQDGHFQWIAYNTDTMEFFGTGGGAFTSKNGTYTENIEYFSRDDSRVGATLDFTYQIKKGDWHHKGKNSKGEPMYEIWARRVSSQM
ncbi:hypothetical protein [Maribacter halichondriae]|uniref:hypothetical protein n=1 Tax=Maribacter halichondriae TaxID=2980554 RepID=UPI002358C910|nr:hypothetical protein [Maribacter sp. Hal144]